MTTSTDPYGQFTPGPAVPMNTLASQAMILPDTTREEWPAIRERIFRRVTACFGTGPCPLSPAVNEFKELERYQKFGLTHIKYRYHVVDDIWSEAVCVLPAKFQDGDASYAILTIHGTNGAVGKYGALGDAGDNRAYAIQLAQRGYVACAPDLFGYGSTLAGTDEAKLVKDLRAKYPTWSYRGIKLLTLIRAIDLLEQLPFAKHGAYGTIGHSLGGGTGLFHAAIDPRVKAAALSSGVSPASSNVFRLARLGADEEPAKWQKINKDGRPPYDIQEVIALCAPRAMLFMEDFNDPYNPDVAASFHAIYQAMQVYQLLGTPARIAALIHGDGHNTTADTREYAYRWFDRYLVAASEHPKTP